MDITLDIAAIVVGSLGFIEATAVAFYVRRKEHKHQKEMQEMRQNHEKSMKQYEIQEQRESEFERVRYQAITDYLDSAGSYLADPCDNSAYAAFRRSLSKIFMYLPEDKHGQVKELNAAIDQVKSVEIRVGDGSYEKKKFLASQAEQLRCQLCEEFKNLGSKNLPKEE